MSTSLNDSGESRSGDPLQDPSPPADEFHYDREQDDSDDEEFVYPQTAESNEVQTTSRPAVAPTLQPSPAQLEALNAAASSGDLDSLKRLFKNASDSGNVTAFNFANDVSSRTGFTALHAAASRGHRDVVAWLIEECGAMPDVEDREGESAIHKASLNGHFDVVTYLVPKKSDVQLRDADGWTALHNACSKGYLDIVKYLCEKGGAANSVDGVRGVDVRSKDGYTPLMNAASKGHLPVVLYLLSKQAANPLVRNKWGETAFDVAAAVFEVWICEILRQAESEKWRASPTPYNPLLIHTTIPLVLYENQRLDTRIKTIAVTGKPKFSAAGLGRNGKRAPFELKLLMPDEESGAKVLPAWRSGVQLPLRESPWVFPRPASAGNPTVENAERSHFWLSDWTLDISNPAVDAHDGWQYAQTFDDADDKWTADAPPALERILANGISGSVSRSSRAIASTSSSRLPHEWVRRRRWVRIMRRRLDMPPLPFLEPDGSMYHLDSDGSLMPYVEPIPASPSEPSEGQELGAMTSTFLSSTQDYVVRARYLVGKQASDADLASPILSTQDARRTIAKLERATMELRQGILGDDDAERKIQAEVLLNAYSRELERRRLSASAQGLVMTSDDPVDGDLDDDDDDSFHYPQSETPRTVASGSQTDYFSRPGVSRLPADLTPQLMQAPDFRVPTHEAPQKLRYTPPTPHPLHATWERDESVRACRDCQRRFNFLNRRHCRKCGRIFCDRCSTYRTILDPADVVNDPYSQEVPPPGAIHRVCHTCFEETTSNIPGQFHNQTSMERIVVGQERLTVPGAVTRRQSSSQLSDLAECPVCAINLDDIGDAAAQESHVKTCLEGGAGSPQSARYLVYRLPAESTLLGVECVICLEEFVKGSTIARLACFCSFHNACLSSWLQRGKSCPVHAR